jgi:hypothetical protein
VDRFHPARTEIDPHVRAISAAYRYSGPRGVPLQREQLRADVVLTHGAIIRYGAVLPGADAAALLVQLALGRVPRLRRHRPDVDHRRRPPDSRPAPAPQAGARPMSRPSCCAAARPRSSGRPRMHDATIDAAREVVAGLSSRRAARARRPGRRHLRRSWGSNRTRSRRAAGGSRAERQGWRGAGGCPSGAACPGATAVGCAPSSSR